MAVAPGSRLGPYEIVASLGAGGMGEVWRGRDTRLQREVAIKILPQSLSDSAQLQLRFDREAKAISSLNHPHICTLHDVGSENGTHYLVMEYLEGESLADRLRKGALPIGEVLKYGQQIASALEGAHRKGIIHRDLKPANVMLTRSGAKLLDFGLASMAIRRPAVNPSTDIVTAEQPLTAEGAIVGTFQYMAPEQLEGLEADARTDIFALGSLLYEMATGRRVFQGTSKTTLIAAIVTAQPEPISRTHPMAPPALDHIVRKCLEKNPDDRWQSAQDVASQLQWISEVSSSGILSGAESGRHRDWRRLALPLLFVAALAGGAALGWLLKPDSSGTGSAARVVRSHVVLPPGIRLAGWGPPSVAISPDGRHIAFVGHDGTMQRLYIRSLDRAEAVVVPGSESAEGPFFSPDGKYVAFAVAVSGMVVDLPSEIRRVPVEGGLPQSICPVEDFFGGTWASDGNIYFVGQGAGGLWQVPGDGGKPRQVPSGDLDIGFPSALPGGTHVLAVVGTRESMQRIVVIDTTSGDVRELPVEGQAPLYLTSGQLAYVGADRRLMVVPFDEKKKMVTGRGAVLLDDIAITGTNIPVITVSDDGTLLYVQGFVTGSNREMTRLVRVGRDGKVAPSLPFPIDTYSRRGLSVSPDGSRVATTTWDGKLWVCDLKRGTRLALLQPEGGTRTTPIWTPDGKSIVFTAIAAGLDSMHMFMQAADGTTPPRQLTAAFPRPFEAWASSWAGPDVLVFNHFSGAGVQVSSLSIREEAAQPRPLLAQPGMWHRNGRVSGDGQWIVYQARERDRQGIFVRRLDLQDGPLLVSMDGMNPGWSSKGEILFMTGARVMAVSFTGGENPHVGEPRELFSLEGLKNFDPVPGSDDLMTIVEEPGSGIQTRLTMVQNWFHDLR